MSVPVIIPARNEAEHIATTLQALPPDVEPYVVPNGCKDETATIAESCGAVVLHGSTEGKIPALQFAIQHLGERALEPFLMLDADSHPRFPNRWLQAMWDARETLDMSRPAVVTGPYLFEGHDPITSTIRNLSKRWDLRSLHKDPESSMSAANMLFDLQEEIVVARILALPNIWRAEDKAIRDQVRLSGGHLAHTINRHARVVTDATDRHLNLFQELMLSASANHRRLEASYTADAPPGSMTYEEYRYLIRRGRLVGGSLG